MNRFCSIFSQVLNLFSRADFERAVTATRAGRHNRGFGCWDHFVAMLFCQLGRAQSLREICGGLASCMGKLVHLGVTQGAPSKSTLAYANGHRRHRRVSGVLPETSLRMNAARSRRPHRSTRPSAIIGVICGVLMPHHSCPN